MTEKTRLQHENLAQDTHIEYAKQITELLDTIDELRSNIEDLEEIISELQSQLSEGEDEDAPL